MDYKLKSIKNSSSSDYEYFEFSVEWFPYFYVPYGFLKFIRGYYIK